MPKKSSDSLHQLIKSLNRNEKRYFKIFMQNNIRHDNKVFDVLFDAIEKQEDYDEKELLKKFADKAFAKQFALTKSRLYDQVLRSLDALYADSSVDAELKQDLHFVEILFRKALYKQAEKLLYLTRKKALKHEKISSLIEISMWQKRLLEKSGYSGDADTDIKELERQDNWLLSQLLTNNDFWIIKSRLFSSLNKNEQAPKQEDLGNLLRKKAEQVIYEELTVENKYIYHHTHSAYYFSLHNYTDCYTHLQSNALLIENNSFLFKDEPNVYFSVLSNLIFICSSLGKKAEAENALQRLRNVSAVFDISNNEDLELKHFNTLSSAEITLYKLEGRYDKALESLAWIESQLSRFKEKLNPTRKAFYFFNLSCVYLANEKFQQSLKWCNELLNEKSIDEKEKSRTYGLVLSLLIHYDLEHIEYLAVIEKQLNKLLAEQDQNHDFVSAFIKFSAGVRSADTQQKRKIVLAALTEQLTAAANKHAIEYFDFVRWAKSRHSGIPFSMIEE